MAGSTDTGVPCLAVRDDALSTLTPTAGDNAHLRVDSQGALHVTHAGDLEASVSHGGVFPVREDGAALGYLAIVAGAVTAGDLETKAVVTERGAEGNLFNAQVITVPYTNSAAIDVSASSRATILIKGNDPTATDGFDIFMSPDGASWTFVQSYHPQTVDGRGATLTDRQGHVSLDLAGI